jgi:Tfp pilus assembly protein PilV
MGGGPTPRRVGGVGRVRALGQDGDTLVEILVALTILGIAVVAILGAMGASVISTDVAMKQAHAETTLRSWVEDLASPDTAYVECATTGAAGYSASAVGVSVPAGMTATITAVAFWDGASTSPATFGSAPGSCPTSDQGLQRLSLRVASSDGKAAKTDTMLKRRP